MSFAFGYAMDVSGNESNEQCLEDAENVVDSTNAVVLCGCYRNVVAYDDENFDICIYEGEEIAEIINDLHEERGNDKVNLDNLMNNPSEVFQIYLS